MFKSLSHMTRLHVICCLGFFAALSSSLYAAPSEYFGIHIIDEQTGRGVPLIELRTVNDIRCVTDNAGWIAFNEPGMMGREVWFYLSLNPGYEKEKDGFGYTGLRVTPRSGESVIVKMKRTNIAERLGRTTGQGLYRDSELLRLPHPLPNLNPAGVMGQDSVQAVAYRGKLFWLWGDTNVPEYPLGNFQTTCASVAARREAGARHRIRVFHGQGKAGAAAPHDAAAGTGRGVVVWTAHGKG